MVRHASMPSGFLKRVARLVHVAAGPLVGIAFLALACWGMYRMLGAASPRDIVAALLALPPSRTVPAVALTVASYFVFTLYDRLSLRWLGLSMPWRRSAPGTAMAYALGNASFNALVVGGGCRYYAWRGDGLQPAQAAQMAVFASVGFWFGYVSLGGLLFAIDPLRPSTRLAGLLILLIPLYLLLSWRMPSLRIARWRMKLPPPRLCMAQIGVGTLDMLCISGVLWLLLPPAVAPGYSHFLQAFMLAMVAGSASQAPGGLGVFDSAFMLLTPGAPEQLLAALLAFRFIYFGAPLAAAALVLALRQARQWRRKGIGPG